MERKSGSDGFLARNAIKRYFSALSPAFAEIGYVIDLELANEDEITEFYSEVIEGRKLHNPQYVFARLKEFHRWLAEQVEVEDPVWAELPCHDGAVPVDRDRSRERLSSCIQFSGTVGHRQGAIQIRSTPSSGVLPVWTSGRGSPWIAQI